MTTSFGLTVIVTLFSCVEVVTNVFRIVDILLLVALVVRMVDLRNLRSEPACRRATIPDSRFIVGRRIRCDSPRYHPSASGRRPGRKTAAMLDPECAVGRRVGPVHRCLCVAIPTHLRHTHFDHAAQRPCSTRDALSADETAPGRRYPSSPCR